MTKPLHAGGEVDSWCTKCKLVLNHRIIAMLGPSPKRVECSTCMSHHNYRPRAPGERAPAAGTRSSAGPRSTAAPRGPRSAAAAAARAHEAAIERERQWEKAISGRALSDFRPYSVATTFSEGELIQHKKFGEGLVMRVVDPSKVEILFRDEARVLAQGMTV